MQNEINELKQRLNKDSSNSHKPPSSDGYKKKIKNNRDKSNRKQGAQEGHEGKTLQMTETPDKIIEHKVEGICECGKSLIKATLINIQRRQEIDLVTKLIETTEYRIEVKRCKCGKIHSGEEGRLIPIQYGNRIKSLMVYLNQYQYIPYERQQELIKDCLGISISDGVLQGANEKCYANLDITEEQIIEAIKTSEVMHNDETGIRNEKETRWIHTSSTDLYTYYSIHEKRGREAIDEIGILPEYKG